MLDADESHAQPARERGDGIPLRARHDRRTSLRSCSPRGSRRGSASSSSSSLTAVAVKVLRGSTAPASAGPPVGPAPRALVEDTRRSSSSRLPPPTRASATPSSGWRTASPRTCSSSCPASRLARGDGAPEERLRDALGVLGRGRRARPRRGLRGRPARGARRGTGAFAADEVVVCTDEPLDDDRVRTRSGGPVTYVTGPPPLVRVSRQRSDRACVEPATCRRRSTRTPPRPGSACPSAAP